MEVPVRQPRATDAPVPDQAPPPALSLLARPGQTGIRTRRVTILRCRPHSRLEARLGHQVVRS
jgi:hypothetical protein